MANGAFHRHKDHVLRFSARPGRSRTVHTSSLGPINQDVLLPNCRIWPERPCLKVLEGSWNPVSGCRSEPEDCSADPPGATWTLGGALPVRFFSRCEPAGWSRRPRGVRQTQRWTASAVSLGLVLKHSFACGAFACTTLISFSKSRKLLGMIRMPAPIITQS